MRGDPFDVDSFCRVFMTSNNAVPVHIEPSDRRFVTIEVPAHEHTNDTEYFGRKWVSRTVRCAWIRLRSSCQSNKNKRRIGSWRLLMDLSEFPSSEAVPSPVRRQRPVS